MKQTSDGDVQVFEDGFCCAKAMIRMHAAIRFTSMTGMDSFRWTGICTQRIQAGEFRL